MKGSSCIKNILGYCSCSGGNNGAQSTEIPYNMCTLITLIYGHGYVQYSESVNNPDSMLLMLWKM